MWEGEERCGSSGGASAQLFIPECVRGWLRRVIFAAPQESDDDGRLSRETAFSGTQI